MWRWLADMLRPRPSHEREASAVRLAKVDAEATYQLQRVRRTLAERDRLADAVHNTSQALQRR